MKLLAITKSNPIAYDSAYLIGRVAARFGGCDIISDLQLLDGIDRSYDCVFNRTIESSASTLRKLTDFAQRSGAYLINAERPTVRAGDKSTYLVDYVGFTPETWVVQDFESLLDLSDRVGFELVIKHPLGKGGREVERYSRGSDSKAVKRLFDLIPRMPLIAQRFCHGFTQGDKRVILHRTTNGGYSVSAWYLRLPPDGGWITNLGLGGTAKQCDLNSTELELCEKVARISGLDYVGLDIGWDNDCCLLIETNAYTGGHMDFDALNQDKNSGDDFARMAIELTTFYRTRKIE
jgi:glutathione synthase/RimK-type ligase-like ATP-grasp enzyme